MHDRYESIRQALDAIGQTHILRHWGSLQSNQRTDLLSQIEELDLAMVTRLASQADDGA